MSHWLQIVVATPAHSNVAGPLTDRTEMPCACWRGAVRSPRLESLLFVTIAVLRPGDMQVTLKGKISQTQQHQQTRNQLFTPLALVVFGVKPGHTTSLDIIRQL